MILQPVTGGGSGGPAADIIDANCLPTDAVKDTVYIAGGMGGGRYTVSKVDIAAASSIQAIGVGIIIAKGVDPTLCRVQISGIITGIYTGLTPGKRLFVGPSSQLVEVPPLPSTGTSLIQKIGYALASDAVLVAPEEPVRMQAA